MSDAWKRWDEYWYLYARAFAQPLEANGLFSSFVTNPCITGADAEAWLRSMVGNMLGLRFRVSTGAVICANDKPRDVPQCDLIAWDPSEMPVVFESSEFALVPIFAARAIIEIKRTGGKAARDKLTKQSKVRQKRLRTVSQMDFVLGVILNDNSDSQPLFDDEHPLTENWPQEQLDPPVIRILCNSQPDRNGIWAFIDFLAKVASWQTGTKPAHPGREAYPTAC